MKGLTTVQKEHRSIAAVLYSLEQILREIREGRIEPPFEFFELVVRYMREFPDRFHHPKEDEHLFARLARRAPESVALIEDAQRQHREAPAKTAALEEALVRYCRDPDAGFEAFAATAVDFIAFQRAHISLEERAILPLAQEWLTDEDWKAIDAAFDDHDDPIFGAEPRAEFDQLFSAIVASAPQPWGVGVRRVRDDRRGSSKWRAFRQKVMAPRW